MSLIATDKIAAYVNEHPEARVPLLRWLKEYPYSKQQNAFSDQEGHPIQGTGNGWAGVDRGEYRVKYRINFSAKTLCITWVGNEQEYQAEVDRELKELQILYPGLKETVKITEVVLKAPKPGVRKNSLKARQNITVLPTPDPNLNRQSLKTDTKYQQLLIRAITLFDAPPNTPEFNELLSLLPLIKNYEQYKLKFPLL
jgi:hypothetical protein